MNLFLNTISTQAKVILFDDNREIINQETFEIKGNESSSLVPFLEKYIKTNGFKFHDINNIVICNGPGSFTGVRTSVLVVNTIAFITKANLTALSYFDLFDDYPIVKSSSKRDCFIKKTPNNDVEIMPNQEIHNYFIESGIKSVYGEANIEFFADVEIIEKIDYMNIIKNIEFDNKEAVDPLYIKKPNIS